MRYPRPPRLSRGVYNLPFLNRNGRRQLVAVDSEGREVTRAFIFKGESEIEIGSLLERLLDEADPQPA